MIAKIFNFQFSIFNSKVRQKGFTLVELLASIIVLVAISSIIAGIISSSLRGNNKANNIENIRQNGNYALNQMSKDIEYAQPFDGVSTGLTKKIKADGEPPYYTNCVLSLSPTPTPDTPYDIIAVRSATAGVVTRYECASPSPPSSPALLSNDISLIDDVTVSLLSCSFICTQNKPTDIPIIRISFSLGPKSSTGLVENSSPPITFETSVILRNYKK